MISDFFTSMLMKFKVLPSHTACADSKVQPPANTESLRRKICSDSVSKPQLHSIEARMVWWRGRIDRLSLTSKEKDSLNCFKISFTWKMFMCAAASSIAKGIPSTRRQIFATVWAFSFVRVNDEKANIARSANNLTASYSAKASSEVLTCSGRERAGM